MAEVAQARKSLTLYTSIKYLKAFKVLARDLALLPVIFPVSNTDAPNRMGTRVSDNFLIDKSFSVSITSAISRRTAFEPISTAANLKTPPPLSLIFLQLKQSWLKRLPLWFFQFVQLFPGLLSQIFRLIIFPGQILKTHVYISTLLSFYQFVLLHRPAHRKERHTQLCPLQR